MPKLKILVIRLSAMGDLVVTTPVLRALHQQLRAEVHVVTKTAFAPIVAHNPYLHRVHVWSAGVVSKLKAERFDLVVDLHGTIRSHLLRVRLGAATIGFRKRNLEKALLLWGVDLLQREHLVDRYFSALRDTGVRPDGEGLDYFPTAAELAAASSAACGSGPAYVVIVLGATHFTKRMPAGLVCEVIRRLGRRVVLLGGTDVVELSREITGASVAGEVLDLCGALPLRVSLAVLAKAEAVITGDTGLMHVGAALRKPMVVVWGSTAPAIGLYPYYPGDAAGAYRDAEVGGLACRPCSRIGFAACPRGHFRCMHDQRASHIVAQVEAVLETVGVGATTVDKRSGT